MQDTMTHNATSMVMTGPHLESLLWTSRRPDQPSAWHGHVSFVHWLVSAARPRLIVELGTERGISYTSMCHAVAILGMNARCYAIDTWQGDAHTGSYDDSIYEDLKAFNDTYYGGFSSLLRCLFDEALSRFERGTIDLLHIDGLHTYEAVKHDFDTWLPKMSERGIVLFHDIAIRSGNFGVWRLWEELQQRYPSFAFAHSAGLGVLLTGASPSSTIAALCQVTDKEEVSNVGEAFRIFSDLARNNGLRDMELQVLRRKISTLQGVVRRSTQDMMAAVDG